MGASEDFVLLLAVLASALYLVHTNFVAAPGQ
jgi:hypothetical protein